MKYITTIIFFLLLTGCTARKEETIYGQTRAEIIMSILTGGTISSDPETVIISGLEWRKCSQGQIYNPISNDCKAADILDTGYYGAYVFAYCAVNDNRCNSTSLPQTLNSSISPAFASCNSIQPAGTWRVPTYIELQSILYDTRNGHLSSFPDAVDGIYWSSNNYPLNILGTSAYALSFRTIDYGETYISYKTTGYYLRCVRSL